MQLKVFITVILLGQSVAIWANDFRIQVLLQDAISEKSFITDIPGRHNSNGYFTIRDWDQFTVAVDKFESIMTQLSHKIDRMTQEQLLTFYDLEFWGQSISFQARSAFGGGSYRIPLAGGAPFGSSYSMEHSLAVIKKTKSLTDSLDLLNRSVAARALILSFTTGQMDEGFYLIDDWQKFQSYIEIFREAMIRLSEQSAQVPPLSFYRFKELESWGRGTRFRSGRYVYNESYPLGRGSSYKP